jgi:signal transduction histidine kinase
VKLRVPGRPQTLFGRLMMAFGVVVIAVLLLSMLILGDWVESAFKRQLAEVMVQDALGVSIWAAPLVQQHDVPADLRQEIPWLHVITEGQLWVVDASGEVLADSGIPSRFRGTVINHPWLDEVLAGHVVQKMTPDPWLGSAITVGRPIELDGKVVGAVFLFSAPTRLHAAISQFRLLVVVTMLSAAMLGLFAAYTLSRTFSRPIEAMSRFADHLGRGLDTPELPTADVAEFDQLARALTDAAAQLQAAFGALTEQQQRIGALITDMAEGVVAVDEHSRLLLVNPAAGELLGLPGPFDELSLEAAGFPPTLVEGLQTALAPQSPDQVQISFPCGGAELVARISPVVGEAEQAFGAVAVLQDVTTETQLRRLRENFVANVSHELRGPLAALSAGVEAMHDGLIGDDARPRYLRSMLAEIGRLRRLVDNLLELSRLDAGMLELVQEEFDLQPLCTGLADKWQPRTDAAGIELTVECPHLRVVANYDRVEEILTNFLDNAVRFTPKGGAIRLFARLEADMVRVGVADTGVGIAKEHLAHIWDRFYKVDPARTRTAGSGTGLGLSIVRQLAQRLGGDVSVTSEPGKGSTFSITLVGARPAHPGN